jgi:predicted O-methyltransferase YrrM
MHRICEIGTHTGGATRAMHRGLAKPADARVVTIDVTRESDKALAGLEGIQKINGDANHETTAARVINAFADGHTIDLLFIDGAHDYLPALLNFGIYTNALSPRFVVMDDININPDMRALWRKIVASRPADTWLDVATVLPDVRAPDVGFGLIAMPENAAAPALHHRVPAVSPIKRTVRNTLRYLASHRLGRI